jgi:tripartite-type tricarboxylate transporter receptor subunit TctC
MKARSLWRAAGLCVASLVVSAAALAQAWPAKQPVRFVVPYPPGGASDVTARLLSVKLTEALGQAFVVENRPGANGLIALEYVAKSAPDGYTILMANLGPNAINPAVYRKLPYDAIKDFTPITLTSVVPLVVLVQPSMPVNSMKELIAYAKAHPDKLTYASAGNGSANHLAGEMMKSMANFKMVHVPYKGDAPGLQDTIAGNVSVIFPTVIGGMSQIKSGLLKPIAVTGAKRSSALSSVPTVAEGGIPNFEANSWGRRDGSGQPAARDRHAAQHRDREDPQAAGDGRQAHVDGRGHRRLDARGVRELPEERSREVGQGGPREQHHVGLSREALISRPCPAR